MKNLKEKFRKSRLAAGLAVAGITWMLSSTAVVQASVPATEICEADAAYASTSESKTEISKKTTSKKVTMKKASAKTYTKTLPAQKKKSSKTVKNTASTVKTDTTVVTQATEKYTKKSKVKVVNTTVTTTVVTTTTKTASTMQEKPNTSTPSFGAPSTSKPNTNTAVEKPQAGKQVLSVAASAPLMDSRVINAFQKLGFTLYSDSSVSYAGYFTAKDRSITLRRNDDTVYHELGHFLSFIAGNMDKSAAFVSVYNQEKNSYTGSNKPYVTQNSSEYFAESVKDYVKNPAALRSARPMTYAAMEEAMAKVTDAQIDRIQLIYGPVWR